MDFDSKMLDRSAQTEQFADDVITHFFASLDKFKKMSKEERVKSIQDSLSLGKLSAEEIDEILPFIELVDSLDDVKRTGWNKKPEPNDVMEIKERKVAQAEDVALHTYGLINLGLLVANDRPEINVPRLIKTIAVHDMAEKITGDQVTAGKTDEAALVEAKAIYEEQSMKIICAALEDPLRSEVFALWEQYEKKETPEAKLLYQLDKLEAVIQAYNYARVPGNIVDPQEFINSARKKITDPKLQRILEHVERFTQQKK